MASFCTEGVFAENDELLGSLEMYCCDPRSPSADELQLIERAKCLAALAIKRDFEAGHHVVDRVAENPLIRGNLHAGLVYLN